MILTYILEKKDKIKKFIFKQISCILTCILHKNQISCIHICILQAKKRNQISCIHICILQK